ncbi:hypothetical protein QLH51_06570 [Sphingomonas sp. 2R-10]|uniref:hypothetical protein n=1 Tax=Sphingomonas sp. 2R-10 TaxID=3045148 RepID=UPI000F79F3D8|nr:hypothetical protein [Sphingomonas sp. 2R-10]MDJ0276456.1 hypothetical protein [Sphingomonas sp. 2R-10]
MKPSFLSALVAASFAGSAALAAGPSVASLDEASAATNLSMQVGLFRLCGMQAALGEIPAQSSAFNDSHTSNGRPLSRDMQLAVVFNTQALVERAGGRQRFCAALAAQRAKSVAGTEASWAKLKEAHAKATTAGH